jgi:hypothetical protein
MNKINDLKNLRKSESRETNKEKLIENEAYINIEVYFY